MSKNQKTQVEFKLIATKVSENGDILTIVREGEFNNFYQGMIDDKNCKIETHFVISESEVLELVIKEGYRLTPFGKNYIK